MPSADLLTRPSAAEPLDPGPAPAAPWPADRAGASPRRLLVVVLAVALLVLAGLTLYALSRPGQASAQLAASGQALAQSQRLARAAPQMLAGDATAAATVRDSTDALSRLQDLPPEPAQLVQRSVQNAATLVAQQKALADVASAQRAIQERTAALQQASEAVTAAKLQQAAPAAEAAAATQLGLLGQRIARNAAALTAADGATAAAQITRDLGTFRDLLQGLRENGVREPLDALRQHWEALRTQSEALLAQAQPIAIAHQAQAAIVADSEPLRLALAQHQTTLADQSGLQLGVLAALGVAALVALLAAAGLARSLLQDSRQRQAVAERQRREAEFQQQQAKRVNDSNQSAILRLMNELQTVAEGDLTRQATVTEDITGAIADSVNYTVEELRALVTSVQNTATRVAQTTAHVDSTSTELLATSTEQLREIRETGRSVLDMASRINTVSHQAQESAQVARQSLQAAESGLTAVQNAIGGMNAIREQIQETSKRIKRLGESSQEIGEITELISDITEQTNVLALNAAIQAASAGEAGRGFSVVAEEVQRLAERSGDATRQIAALVKTIQTDTQDAVAAMERSTQGVVAGARLSDSAGTALTEIDRVSRQLAELIADISGAASQEATLANGVAENIQHIFAVTEQTGEGTRATAQQVRELAGMAEELRKSVARFKIV